MYPDNGSPYGVLASGSARTEMVLTNLLDDKPATLHEDSADVIAAEVAAIKADRALAAARAKLAAPEMGGTTLDLSEGDDARKLRALLRIAGNTLRHVFEGRTVMDGTAVTVEDAAALRKRINQGVVRNCERRTGGAA